ncbi:MAG: D-alanine--D-serine ligase VanG [Oscillospiraceae bacterium]|nr:D-alanine--D-serine ligase VanG [Oscillospiraceae bacterium]
MKKQKIAVLFGGCSPEYEVSLKSAYSVITHMDRRKYDPVLLGITRAGEWFHFVGAPQQIVDDTWHNPANCERAIISPSREVGGVLIFGGDGSICSIGLDAAMPVFHGKNGEDGLVQGLLELAGIPIVGCGTLASALCMDKDRAHKIVGATGIRVPRAFTLQGAGDMERSAAEAEVLGYPLFVKPVKAGSSYGITKVSDKSDLAEAIEIAFRYDDAVILEENIEGFEVGCAVLGQGDHLTVGELDEIELVDGFFDFKEKYTLESSMIHVPARISAQQAVEIKAVAKRIYRALGCSGFARVDVFLTPSGEIVFNEVNTIPGFTPHSRYPNMLKAIGMSFGEVIDRVIALAVGGAKSDSICA